MLVSDAVLSRELDGETVLLDLEGEGYYGLNRVGTRIWQLLKEGREFNEMITALEREFDAPRGTLETDVRELLVTLKSAGIIRCP